MHIELEPEKEEKDESEPEDDEDLFVQKYKAVVPTIHDDWIELSPNLKEFVDLIDQTFSSGMSCIKSFVRWNKHRDLLDYSKVLKDWDWEDTVGDNWDTPDSDYLDPESWIREDAIHITKNKQV